MTNVPIHRLRVSSWHYQLQNVVVDDIAALDRDLVVIDAAKPDTNDMVWPRKDVERMKADGKKLIAYLSIGEAEDYRAYWKKEWVGRNWLGMSRAPKWLGPENPDWKGNYKVRYWESEWQKIIFKRVEEIARAGFDGLYLDIIDAYEFYDSEVWRADSKMIDFVIAIAQHARTYASSVKFAIIPQNGEGLLTSAAYREVVSAIGKEDVFFGQDDDGVENHENVIEHTVALLERHAKGNLIQPLFVEYAPDFDDKHDPDLDEMFSQKIAEKMPRSMWKCPVIIAARELDQDTYELPL